jgi:hypothetical protein
MDRPQRSGREVLHGHTRYEAILQPVAVHDPGVGEEVVGLGIADHLTPSHALGQSTAGCINLEHRIHVAGVAGVERLIRGAQRVSSSLLNPDQLAIWGSACAANWVATLHGPVMSSTLPSPNGTASEVDP